MIQDIEELRAKPEIAAFLDGEVFEGGKINGNQVRPGESVAAGVAHQVLAEGISRRRNQRQGRMGPRAEESMPGMILQPHGQRANHSSSKNFINECKKFLNDSPSALSAYFLLLAIPLELWARLSVFTKFIPACVTFEYAARQTTLIQSVGLRGIQQWH